MCFCIQITLCWCLHVSLAWNYDTYTPFGLMSEGKEEKSKKERPQVSINILILKLENLLGEEFLSLLDLLNADFCLFRN